jgi:hypothetical protein
MPWTRWPHKTGQGCLDIHRANASREGSSHNRLHLFYRPASMALFSGNDINFWHELPYLSLKRALQSGAPDYFKVQK